MSLPHCCARECRAAAREQQGRLEGFPELARFGATVEMVLADQAREDLEPGARITGGITFDAGRPVEDALQSWQAVVDDLREDA